MTEDRKQKSGVNIFQPLLSIQKKVNRINEEKRRGQPVNFRIKQLVGYILLSFPSQKED